MDLKAVIRLGKSKERFDVCHSPRSPRMSVANGRRVIGGGITTGSLICPMSWANNGFDRCLWSSNGVVGWGSSGSAKHRRLLQYEIDTHMVDLAKQYGEFQCHCRLTRGLRRFDQSICVIWPKELGDSGFLRCKKA